MKKIKYLLLGIAATTALIVAVVTNATESTKAPLKQMGKFPGAMLRAAGAPTEEMISSLIVRPRQQAGSKLGLALQARDASALAKTVNVAMRVKRQMSGGAHVITLDQPVTLTQAHAIAARLMQDASVELAEPDRKMRATGVTPTDPNYGLQWHYFAPAGANKGGANLPNAWAITTGSAAITVAVLDTGYRQHADLATVLQGYDFIGDLITANDGDIRDTDAQDPGDWADISQCGDDEFATDSSWHGTYVIGVIAALMSNGIGGLHGTGIAPGVKILPVRVLGKCGGVTSDIVDSMRWAAGIAVTGVPVNANPAHVLNMSLGASGACSAAFQSAVNDVLAAGKVIVAATGNSGTTSVHQPANCSGVIAVTAHAIDGDNADYASIGIESMISAPGGGCGTLANSCTRFVTPNGLGVYSLWNDGSTTPGADSYINYVGTSAAAPHVSGVIALMLSVNAGLTPTQIKSYLKSSARPHPAGSLCTLSAYVGMCGAGLLDAEQAVISASVLPPVLTLTNTYQVTTANQLVALSSTVTAGANSLSSYAWSQSVGNPAVVTITNPNAANASFTPSIAGTYAFTLTATDSAGHTGAATATVKVNAATVTTTTATTTATTTTTTRTMAQAPSGGGGSLDEKILVAMILVAVSLRLFKKRASMRAIKAGKRN